MPSRPVVIAGSVLGASLALFGAFWLGAWAFDTRQFISHDTRLRHMVQEHPSLDRATKGLEDEGSGLVAAPRGEDELRRVVAAPRGRWIDLQEGELDCGLATRGDGDGEADAGADAGAETRWHSALTERGRRLLDGEETILSDVPAAASR